MRVFITHGAMPDEVCRTIQAAMDQGIPERAEVLTEGIGPADDVRRACHIEVPASILNLAEACLDGKRDAVGAFFGKPLRSREGASLLRYTAGGFYGPHEDRADLPSWPEAASREVTVVLFLTGSRTRAADGSFSGGLLRLFPAGPDAASIDIPARRGTLVAFPADMVHEVTPVEAGRRDVVVDWFRC